MKRIYGIALGLAGLAATAGVASASPAYTEAALNLRTGPGTGYAIVTSMPPGAPVNIIDCYSGWCEITWGGYRGFASRSYLTSAGYAAPSYAPPAYYGSYGPSVGIFYGGDYDRRRHYRGRRDNDHGKRGHYGRGGRDHDRGGRNHDGRRGNRGDHNAHRGGGNRSNSGGGRPIGQVGDGGGKNRGGDNRGG